MDLLLNIASVFYPLLVDGLFNPEMIYRSNTSSQGIEFGGRNEFSKEINPSRRDSSNEEDLLQSPSVITFPISAILDGYKTGS